MESNSFYIQAIHKINTIKLRAYVLDLGEMDTNSIAYDDCPLTKVINKKIADNPENAGVLLQIDYVHKQYHENAEKIIQYGKDDKKKAFEILDALKDNSSYIMEQVLKF